MWGEVRGIGLADGVGLVAACVALAWLPGAVDPLTYIKLLVLVGGAGLTAPFAFIRWKSGGWKFSPPSISQQVIRQLPVEVNVRRPLTRRTSIDGARR